MSRWERDCLKKELSVTKSSGKKKVGVRVHKKAVSLRGKPQAPRENYSREKERDNRYRRSKRGSQNTTWKTLSEIDKNSRKKGGS